jgi:hypothetical protein
MICDVLSKHVGTLKVFNVYNFRQQHDIQLVHLLVCNTQWILFHVLKSTNHCTLLQSDKDCRKVGALLFSCNWTLVKPELLRFSRKTSTLNCKCFNCFHGSTAPQWASASSLSRIHVHTSTQHTRWDSFEGVIGTSPKPLPDNTQDSQGRHQFPRQDSNPQSQEASDRRPTP